MNMLSVLQYAVEALEVTDIIVTGHYECGGVAAAMKEQDLGLIENWLRNIRGEDCCLFKRCMNVDDGRRTCFSIA